MQRHSGAGDDGTAAKGARRRAIKTTLSHANGALIRSPATGRMDLCPPSQIVTDLEIYDHGDLLACILQENGATVRVHAPGRGFILRMLVPNKGRVSIGDDLMLFRRVWQSGG